MTLPKLRTLRKVECDDGNDIVFGLAIKLLLGAESMSSLKWARGVNNERRAEVEGFFLCDSSTSDGTVRTSSSYSDSASVIVVPGGME